MAGSTSTATLELNAIDNSSAVINRISGAVGKLESSFKSLMSFTIAGIGIEQITSQTIEFEQTSNRLNAVLRATGESAGLTRHELDTMAESLSGSTTYTAHQIANAEANLLKFGNIHEDVFRRALKLSADYAAFTGGDMASATQAIGRALADPVAGIRTLQKEIGNLTFSQKEYIAQLEANGKVEQAQIAILDIIHGKVGGVAGEMNAGITKATRDASKATEEFMEQLGKIKFLQPLYAAFAWTVHDIAKVMEGSKPFHELILPVPPGTKGQLASGRIITADIFGSGESAAETAAKASAAAARSAEEADRVREAWAKATPVLDAWKRKLTETTQEQIALDFVLRGEGRTLIEAAKVQILNISLELDRRKQNAERITAEYSALTTLVQRRHEEDDLREKALLADKLANDALQFQITLIGKTTYEQERLTAIRQIDLATRERIRSATAALPEDAMSGDIEKAIRDAERLGEAQKTLILDSLKTRRDVERDWVTASRLAFQDYIDNATNAAQQAQMLFGNVFRNMEDALVNFVKTGKLDFKSLADSIISDLIRIEIQRSITGPLAAALGGSGGIVGGLGNLFSGGSAAAAGSGALEGALLGAFAGGGAPAPNTWNLVGERGPELAYFGAGGGTVIPNDKLGGDTYYIDARGADWGGLARLEATIRAVNGSIERRAVNAWRNASNVRGVATPLG